MQTNQQINKKKDDQFLKLQQRPLSAATSRSEYNFRFNSKSKAQKK